MTRTNIILGTIIVGLIGLQGAEAASGGFTLTSIVQRGTGVMFGITTSSGQQMVISAPQAKTLIEHTCPRIKIADGVLQ